MACPRPLQAPNNSQSLRLTPKSFKRHVMGKAQQTGGSHLHFSAFEPPCSAVITELMSGAGGGQLTKFQR